MLYSRGYWYKYFSGQFCGDTNITRFYAENANKDRASYVQKLKLLWQGKRLLIVEGEKTRMGMGNDLFNNAADIKRILCPPKNAFSKYDEILTVTKEQIKTGNYDLLICALGPTATVLCYDLSNDIQALDLGHVDIEYEWFLSGSENAHAIENKAVTEVTDNCGDDVTDIYNQQIISIIK